MKFEKKEKRNLKYELSREKEVMLFLSIQITKCASTAETGKGDEASRDVSADLCSCGPGQLWKCYHVSKPTGASTALSNQASSPRRKQLAARASHLLY